RALCRDPSAMAAHDLLADVEAKPHTGDVARRAVGRAVKEPEDRLELVRRDPDPLIAHGEPHPVPLGTDLDRDRPTAGRVLARVRDEVLQHLLDAITAGRDYRGPVEPLHADRAH